ncbi:unnamed protein product [Peronospora belbahrii]|uniref:Tyrosine specific protein phosphatases domain-containing protein n=1 Tax=Peronospora belbahrii TaxID=622444 RepID=A0AAU9KMR8_9STRA|nr:unnamed protein product [Peronospora belbahrii]
MPRGRNCSASPPRHRSRRRKHSSSRPHSPRRSESRKSRQNWRRNRGKHRKMGKKKDQIPDNWVDVAKMGTIIGTSRFVALRVPLDDKYLSQLETKKDEIWTPTDFLTFQKDQNLNIKMIIDLTNTFKYYNGKDEFKNSEVKYVKLAIEGFRGPPEAQDVAKFMKIVDEFIAKEPEGTIAVHCTHGLNRTGYLVVTYMVKRLHCSVTEALEAFKIARPPGLIKHMYIEDLYKQLGENEEVRLPVLPKWASAKYSRKAVGKKKRG